jgi:hypothetical protein
MDPRKLTISAMVNNKENRYDGDLRRYFQVLFFHAKNTRHPYHNFRHMFHVFYHCYQAAVFYGEKLSRREVRNLLVASLFHDFDHSGQLGDDDLNIEKAIRGLRKYATEADRPHLHDIETLIRITEYPYRIPSSNLDLLCQILRDADVSQALNPAWIQQVVFGLSDEWGKSALEVLKSQPGFHSTLEFKTAWAEAFFPKEMIDEKIAEARELIAILEDSLAA